MTTLSDGKAALNALYWRAEILQAMFWMRGEGLASQVEPVHLAEFLAVDAAEIEIQMRALAADGFLQLQLKLQLVEVSAAGLDAGSRYELTPQGVAEGGRSFQDEFAELTHSAHYECAPGCWCHDPDHIGEPCPSTPPPTEPPPAEPEPVEDQHG